MLIIYNVNFILAILGYRLTCYVKDQPSKRATEEVKPLKEKRKEKNLTILVSPEKQKLKQTWKIAQKTRFEIKSKDK